MESLETELAECSSHGPGNRPGKIIVGACLIVSLTVHVVAIIVVMLASLQRSYEPNVTYVDINSIAESVPPSTPVIHAPAPHPRNIEADRPVTEPETISESTEAEVPIVPVTSPAAEVLATSLGRGMTSGYFSSFADGKNLRDDIREYYFTLLEKINVKWWLKAETLKETAAHDGVMMFAIGRDGVLIDVKLIKGTGSREVDLAIIEVLKDTAPFPPLPENYTPDRFMAPLKIAAPLHLFSVRSLR